MFRIKKSYLKYFLLGYFLFFINLFYCLSQAISDLPLDFDQIQPALSIRNPAHVSRVDYIQFQSGYRGFNSLSNNLKTFYTDIYWRPRFDKGHFFGGNFFSDQEGKFISQNRVYLKYAYLIALNKKTDVSLGAGIGFVDFQINSNQAIGGFSAIQTDAQVGLSIHRNKFSSDFSVLQFLDRTLALNTSKIILKRYYQTFIAYQFDLNSEFSLEEGIFVRYASSYSTDFRIQNELTYKKIVYSSIALNWLDGYVFAAGFNNYIWQELNWKLGISYRVWRGSIKRQNTNVMEFTLGISVPHKGIGVTKIDDTY